MKFEFQNIIKVHNKVRVIREIKFDVAKHSKILTAFVLPYHLSYTINISIMRNVESGDEVETQRLVVVPYGSTIENLQQLKHLCSTQDFAVFLKVVPD